jgi:hypothetical protein
MVALSPMMQGLYADSEASAALRGALGVRDVLEGLSPGMTATVEYGWPGMPAGLYLSQGSITMESLGHSAVIQLSVRVDPVMLEPGVPYVLTLSSGVVEVSRGV